MVEDDDMVAKARAELEQVRTEIDRLKVRETRLQQFVELFGDERKETNPPPKPVKKIDFNAMLRYHVQQRQEKVAATTKNRVAVAVREMLADGKSLRTRDILRELTIQGISVGSATDKVLALSRILSQDKDFLPDRSAGWSLRKK